MRLALDTDAAARMDRIYRAQRFIYDATRRPYLLGRARLIDELAPPVGGHVLEIACGTAWNLARAAERYPTCRFYGFDISAVMLETAAKSVQRRGLRDRVALAHADATRFDAGRLFGRARFDRVFVSYALSMVPAWQDALVQAMQVVADGGSLHVLDFGLCENLPAAFRSSLYAWLAQFSVRPIAGFADILARHAADAGFACAVSPLYRGYAIRATLRRPH